MSRRPRARRILSCFQEARAFPLRLPGETRIGGKGSSKCAASCSKDRALLGLGVADQAEEDLGVAEVDLVGEEDSAVAEDSVAGEEGLEVEGIGREAGRE
jgi:hypothetical protein